MTDTRDKNLLLMSVLRCYGVSSSLRERAMDFVETEELLSKAKRFSGINLKLNLLLDIKPDLADNANTALLQMMQNTGAYQDLCDAHDFGVEALKELVRTQYHAAFNEYQKWSAAPQGTYFTDELGKGMVHDLKNPMKKAVLEILAGFGITPMPDVGVHRVRPISPRVVAEKLPQDQINAALRRRIEEGQSWRRH